MKLLPHFDPYTVAIYNHPQHLSPEAKDKVYRTAGWISAVGIINGKIEGVWELEKGRSEATVKLAMFSPPQPG